jgi:acyl-homoserine lactone acylase PvdQ
MASQYPFDTQVSMYASLPSALESLTDDQLTHYYPVLDFQPLAGNDVASVLEVSPGVQIIQDKTHFIAHVHVDTRAHAMFGVGYARAMDRLWQMDNIRHEARANSAALGIHVQSQADDMAGRTSPQTS